MLKTLCPPLPERGGASIAQQNPAKRQQQQPRQAVQEEQKKTPPAQAPVGPKNKKLQYGRSLAICRIIRMYVDEENAAIRCARGFSRLDSLWVWR